MAITGSGTSADPYILNTYSDLVASRDKTSICIWNGGDLDFNVIQPSGFTWRVDIWGSIDFKGATFSNFFGNNQSVSISDMGAIWFRHGNGGYIKNLNFVNFHFIVGRSGLIRVGDNSSSNLYSGSMTGCKFSGKVNFENNEPSLIQVNRHTGYSGNYSVNSCSVNVEGVTTGSGYFSIFNSTAQCYFCNIKVDLKGPRLSLFQYPESSSSYDRRLVSSIVTGKMISTDETKPAILGAHQNDASNIYLMDEGDYIFKSSSELSLYSTDGITVSSVVNNCVGLTREQLKSIEAVRATGFPIGAE